MFPEFMNHGTNQLYDPLPIISLKRTDCEAQVKGFPGASYQKYKTLYEANEFAGISSPNAAVLKTQTQAPENNQTLNPVSTSSKPKSVAPSSTSASGQKSGWEGWNIVYTDGACKGNGKAGSIAGIGVWWGWDDPR